MRSIIKDPGLADEGREEIELALPLFKAEEGHGVGERAVVISVAHGIVRVPDDLFADMRRRGGLSKPRITGMAIMGPAAARRSASFSEWNAV